MSTDKKIARIVVVCAPSGSGKTTVVHQILKQYPVFAFSVSATTRAIREKETDGKDYHFLSEKEFRDRIRKGDFLEWEEVYPGRFYGTLHSEVERLLAEGRNVLFDVDVMGGLSIKEHFGDRCVTIFIKAPSLQEIARRLAARGTDSPAEIKRRLAKASRELVYAGAFDHVVLNDKVEKAVERVVRILKKKVAGV